MPPSVQLTKRQRTSKRVPRHDYRLLANFGKENLQATAVENQVAQPGKRQKRKRTIVTQSRVSHVLVEEELQNEYERQRAERIKRNAQFLQNLEVHRLADDLSSSMRPQATAAVNSKPSKPMRPRAAPAALPPARKSSRQRGLKPADGPQPSEESASGCSAAEEAGLMGLDEYFAWKGQSVEGLKSNGSFNGWVCPAVCEQYGIASSADDAWESNGGGKFSFKIDKNAIPAGLKSRGWSDARAFSSTQLKKNPNAYFYRHVAPHEQQAHGEWTQEEHDLFLETAKRFGVGDKWGLFSSHIPQRVGYQCSAYHREVMIPQGLILDPKFRMTRDGKAVYVG